MFQNWNSKNDGTGTNYSANNTLEISSNTIIYAIWKTANYSTVKSGVTTYYVTLADAVSGATSGGGDTGGGTITVLREVTDNTTVQTSKTITINTNGKTITRNKAIDIKSGTLTIKGTGTINSSTYGIVLYGGKLTINDMPTIKSTDTSIFLRSDAEETTININGGYIYSTGATALGIYGDGTLNIDSTYVYAQSYNKNALRIGEEENKTDMAVTIQNSHVGNGKNASSNADAAGTIVYYSNEQLTISNSKILAGPNAASAIMLYTAATVNIVNDSRIYATNESGKNCIYIEASGSIIRFDAEGYFYCTGDYVVWSGNYNIFLDVRKGRFVSRNKNKYMFYVNGAVDKNHVSTNEKKNEYFMYMNNYNSTGSISIDNCYYYRTGF